MSRTANLIFPLIGACPFFIAYNLGYSELGTWLLVVFILVLKPLIDFFYFKKKYHYTTSELLKKYPFWGFHIYKGKNKTIEK